MSTIVAQICIRRDTAANFTSANPTLALGEIAYETDTRNIKVGDGATAWTALGYINPYRGGTAAAPTSNTVIGNTAGAALESGATDNVLLGATAGDSITTGDQCIVIGSGADVAAATNANSIVIGHNGLGNGSNTTTIGNSSTTGTFIPAGNLTLTNGNFIVGTAGKGIDFAITSDGTGTMTSELLSDYEEGTWTPVYAPATGSFTTLTMDVVNATYTKIGRVVVLSASIRTDDVNATGASGQLRISGIPFAISNSPGQRSPGVVALAGAWAGDTPLSVLASSGTSTTQLIMCFRTSVNGADSLVDVSDMTTGATADRNEISFTICYRV